MNVNFNGKRIYTASSGTIFVVPIDTVGLKAGKYPVVITLIDANLKTIEKTVTINILAR